MLKSKYKAIIFDFDDTLFESRKQKWAQHQHVAKNFFGIDLSEETIAKQWGKPINVLALEIYQHKDNWENIHKILRKTKDLFPKKIYPKTKRVVEELFKMDIKIGVLSAATAVDVTDDFIIHNFPINQFTVIQGAEKTLVHKPHPDVFLPVFEILQKEGVNKKEIVYVGDSLTDMEAAQKAEIDFIAVTTGLYSFEDFKKAGAKVIIKDIGELLDHI